ncbi:MAG TPA: hypothetical protein P5572_06215 [Phycisphaerae bacterium]|nr:hypothetical protein [Phycisphaerales bacterium]HRX84599.1 hypothetical protein [Phycisphaerae bacterium]
MTAMNVHIERLIVRRLDGEITPEERVELDRELQQNPAARAMLDAYAALDELAATVLRESAERKSPRLVVTSAAPRHAVHPGRWMVLASALAACLALIVFLSTPESKPSTPLASASPALGSTHPHHPLPVVGSQPASAAGVWRAADLPEAHIDQTTNRNLLMVTDQKGNVYFLNLDVVQEVEHDDSPRMRYANNPI